MSSRSRPWPPSTRPRRLVPDVPADGRLAGRASAPGLRPRATRPHRRVGCGARGARRRTRHPGSGRHPGAVHAHALRPRPRRPGFRGRGGRRGAAPGRVDRPRTAAPGIVDAAEWAARAWSTVDRDDEAAARIEYAIGVAERGELPTVDLRFQLGRYLLWSGRADDARDTLEELYRGLDPETPPLVSANVLFWFGRRRPPRRRRGARVQRLARGPSSALARRRTSCWPPAPG